MKIVVIGSGLLGLCTSYYCAKAGHSVTVLERQNGVALETSFANASLLTPGFSAPFISRRRLKEMVKSLWSSHSPFRINPYELPSVFFWGLRSLRFMNTAQFKKGLNANMELAQYNQRLIQQLLSDFEPIDFDHSSAGTMTIFWNKPALQHAIEDMKQLVEFGINVETLDVDGVIDVEPATRPISKKLAGGLNYEGDSHGDPYKFSKALEQRCRKMGVEFKFGTEITNIHKKDGVITSIVSDNEEYIADTYVIAAGSFTTRLTRIIGLSIPIYPVKGYSITLNVSGWFDAPKVPIVDGEQHVAVTPLGGQLRVAGIAEFAGHNQEVLPERVNELSNHVKRIYPELSPDYFLNGLSPWSGLRPLTCDGVPIVGRSLFDNLFLNTGHGPLGWSMSAASGKVMADLISDVKPEVELEHYTPLRFN